MIPELLIALGVAALLFLLSELYASLKLMKNELEESTDCSFVLTGLGVIVWILISLAYVVLSLLAFFQS